MSGSSTSMRCVLVGFFGSIAKAVTWREMSCFTASFCVGDSRSEGSTVTLSTSSRCSSVRAE